MWVVDVDECKKCGLVEIVCVIYVYVLIFFFGKKSVWL